MDSILSWCDALGENTHEVPPDAPDDIPCRPFAREFQKKAAAPPAHDAHTAACPLRSPSAAASFSSCSGVATSPEPTESLYEPDTPKLYEAFVTDPLRLVRLARGLLLRALTIASFCAGIAPESLFERIC